jgi:hypothetical protein
MTKHTTFGHIRTTNFNPYFSFINKQTARPKPNYNMVHNGTNFTTGYVQKIEEQKILLNEI